ncbi:DMT family transporter [Candidatus Roizmanbacteria bacterium]|nr:DMT family transporter [Candidatus Roizmanbacteria bacterium]
MKLQEERKGVLALVVLAFGFGLIAISARYLSYSFTLFQQLYLSIGVGFIFGLVIFNRKVDYAKIKKIPRKDWLIIFSRVIIGYLFGASLYRESLVLTKISNVVFLQSIPFGAILGFILFKEKATFSKILFLTIAFIGAVLISVKDYSQIFSFGRGELFSLISGLLFSLSYVLRKWQTKFLNNEETTQLLFLVGFIVLFVVSIVNHEGLPVFNWNTLMIVALLVTGFLNAVNLFLINYGYQHVPVVLATNILMLESVFGTILGFIFFKEVPLLKEFLGGTLIIASVIQMNRLEENEK